MNLPASQANSATVRPRRTTPARLHPLGSAAALALLALVACLGSAHAQTEVGRTRHNLASSGPGTVRSNAAAGTCVFCHTPHNAHPSQGLWNRDLPAGAYQVYSSSTSKATPNQPTGSSRLCLSCHDGLLAMETLKVPPRGERVTALGVLTGKAVLGRNLSGDHPISFTYDSALAARHGGLVDPTSLPSTVKLDSSGQMQCTSCHDPHEDGRPNFLRMDTAAGALCTACHRMPAWGGSAHATSTATWNGTGQSPLAVSPTEASTVASSACFSCHRVHGAPHAQRLLVQNDEAAACNACHSGSVTTTSPAKNIAAELTKPFRHPVEGNLGGHDPGENPLLAAAGPRHVTCTDCHNPHAVNSAPAAAPTASGRLRGVTSVTMKGSVVADPTFEYEVCSKCHGIVEPTTSGIARQDSTRNVRLRIDSTNPSFHPIAATGRNPTMPGLMPGYTASSSINCTSCHNNNDATLGTVAPLGPHGSIYEPILERQYLTTDPTPESAQAYDMCYKCHSQPFLINDQARTFHHRSHVVGDNATCASCHDPHGSRKNAHLIDFMLRDRNGKSVVTPSATLGRLEYVAGPGPGHGSCYLQCHGSNHEPKSY
jgi:predicted CXXCH cytochrome family protein